MTKIRMLNYGALVLLMILTGYEVWWAQQSLLLAMLCGAFVTACAWWVGVSFGKALQSATDLNIGKLADDVYEREYRRLIAREKQRDPSLAPFIDQQTIAAGHGVIDAEG